MTRFARWLATVGPIGFWPWGPGTLASLIVVVVWVANPVSTVAWGLGVVAVVVVGVVTSGIAERALGPDDGRIVIDEVAGQALAVATFSHTWESALVAFVGFRVLDIFKPPPIGVTQRVSGGAGVMLDDVVAGLVVAVAGWVWGVVA